MEPSSSAPKLPKDAANNATPSTTTTRNPQLTLVPGNNFIFAEQTNKGAILAIGTPKPTMIGKFVQMLNLNGMFKKEPALPDLARQIRAADRVYSRRRADNEPLRRVLAEGLRRQMAAQAFAQRAGPILRSPFLGTTIIAGFGYLCVKANADKENAKDSKRASPRSDAN